MRMLKPVAVLACRGSDWSCRLLLASRELVRQPATPQNHPHLCSQQLPPCRVRLTGDFTAFHTGMHQSSKPGHRRRGRHCSKGRSSQNPIKALHGLDGCLPCVQGKPGHVPVEHHSSSRICCQLNVKQGAEYSSSWKKISIPDDLASLCTHTTHSLQIFMLNE